MFDQNMYDGRFMEEFNEAEFKLKAVSAIATYSTFLANTCNYIRDLGQTLF